MSYYIKSTNKGYVTIGDLTSGESDLELKVEEAVEATKMGLHIFGLFSDNSSVNVIPISVIICNFLQSKGFKVTHKRNGLYEINFNKSNKKELDFLRSCFMYYYITGNHFIVSLDDVRNLCNYLKVIERWRFLC